MRWEGLVRPCTAGEEVPRSRGFEICWDTGADRADTGKVDLEGNEFTTANAIQRRRDPPGLRVVKKEPRVNENEIARVPSK